MQDFSQKKRALRRAQSEVIRTRVRKKARREYEDQFLGPYLTPSPWSYKKIYAGLMRNDGHWVQGGCWRQGCWCKKHGQDRPFRTTRDEYMSYLHYQELMKGDYDDMSPDERNNQRVQQFGDELYVVGPYVRIYKGVLQTYSQDQQKWIDCPKVEEVFNNG